MSNCTRVPHSSVTASWSLAGEGLVLQKFHAVETVPYIHRIYKSSRSFSNYSLQSCTIMIILEMKASVLLLLLLISTDSVLSQSVDLTLVPEANGTAVVQACISKLTTSNIFSNDNQMLRRIAFVETRDGNNANTYRDNYHGGIWQLSESKFQQTKSSDSQLLTSITNTFDISWSTVQWMDLRRPLYSAIAARLYFQLISVSIPLAVDLSGQASYWVDQYTSNNGSTTNFTTGVNELLALEGDVNHNSVLMYDYNHLFIYRL